MKANKCTVHQWGNHTDKDCNRHRNGGDRSRGGPPRDRGHRERGYRGRGRYFQPQGTNNNPPASATFNNDATTNSNPPSQDNSGRACYHCKQQGHRAFECPIKQQKIIEEFLAFKNKNNLNYES